MARRKGVEEKLEQACGAPFMAPLYDTKAQKKEDARVCIDRYEFPSMPCDYPVTWVTTREAQNICKALGKRLCDAHEWEGACAGSLLPVEEEYAFGRDRDGMRGMHDIDREIVWAYGRDKDHSKCGTMSKRSDKCQTSGWKECGSNTYPAGSFPECRSRFGVYDLHGNAAEHMLLPMKPEELGREGGTGVPEMKGSWFIFSITEAHIDDCRWRSPPWHANEGMNHRNYHLGFRCCKDVAPAAGKPK
jgi:formylglycine-generating enzyme required for sulfatase activity